MSLSDEGEVGGIDNPVYDAQLTLDVEVEEEIADDIRGTKGEQEYAGDTEPEDEESASCKAAASAAEEKEEIAVTFTEGDLPNTLSAHVSTPEASFIINMNISLPDTLDEIEDKL